MRTTLGDGSRWDHGYDSLGQVTSGKRYWDDGTPAPGQQFAYGFDDIGNRKSTQAGGDAAGGGLRSATYAPNALNQYSSRTVPGAVDMRSMFSRPAIFPSPSSGGVLPPSCAGSSESPRTDTKRCRIRYH